MWFKVCGNSCDSLVALIALAIWMGVELVRRVHSMALKGLSNTREMLEDFVYFFKCLTEICMWLMIVDGGHAIASLGSVKEGHLL